MKKLFHKGRFTGWTAIALFSLLLCVVFILYPFILLIQQSMFGEGTGFSMDNYTKIFTTKKYLTALRNSFITAGGGTILAGLVGIPMAYIVSRTDIRFKKLIETLCILSMLSPPFIDAYAWIMLRGRMGIITRIYEWLFPFIEEIPSIYGFRGILLVFTVKLFPYFFLYVSGALNKMDASLEEASENLGISGFQKLCKITMPLIWPTIASSALIVFMTALADYGTPALLGEGRVTVLPVLIYNEYLGEVTKNTALANSLSVIMIAIALIILVLQKKSIASKSYYMSGLRRPRLINLKPLPRVLCYSFISVVLFVSMLPLGTIVYTSFRNTNGPSFADGYGFGSYITAFKNLGLSIRNTFVYSLVALAIIVVLAILLAYIIVRKPGPLASCVDMLIMFPYIIPGSIIGIMLVKAFNTGPIVLSGTAFIMIMSYCIRKMPYTLRSSIGILYQIEPSIEEASINLGVPPLKTFLKTTAQLMIPGVLSGAILSWVAVINELSSSMIMYTGRTVTMAITIYREVSVNTHYGVAAALGTILFVATVISLVLFRKVSGDRSISEF